MSPEHDNNLQPTLEMSAPESSSDAPQTAASQAKTSPGTGAATAAARALDPVPSAPARELFVLRPLFPLSPESNEL